MKPAAHQYEDRLLELAYGELPVHEASAVESHVRGCARCAEALSEIRAVRSTMGQLPVEPAPQAGLESLFAYAEAAARRSAAGPAPVATWWRKLLAPAMAVGALSLVAVVFVRSNSDRLAASPEQVAVSAERVKAADAAKKERGGGVEPVAAAAPEPAGTTADEAVWAREAAQKEAITEEAAFGAEDRKRMNAPKVESMRDGLGARTAVKAAEPAPAPAKYAPDLGDQLSRGKDLSKSKKAAGELLPNDAPAMDYSNAYRGGADKAGGKKGAGQAVAQASETDAPAEVPMGLSTGRPPTEAQGISGGAQARTQVQAEQAKPTAPPGPPLAQQPAPAQATGSLGMSIARSDSRQRQLMGPGSSERGAREEKESNAPAAAPSSAATPRQMVTNLDSSLKQAEAARRDGDARTEVQLSMQVLRDSHATREQRLKALYGVCTGLYALELYEQSYEYCALLIREFPDSAQARQVQQQQSLGIQRPAAKRAKRPQNEYESDEAQVRPSPAAEPQDAPAVAK